MAAFVSTMMTSGSSARSLGMPLGGIIRSGASFIAAIYDVVAGDNSSKI